MASGIIHNIFSIGRFCSADYLLNDMYIRGYSSPFSWITIDLETALYFIHKKFEGFTDAIEDTTKNEFVNKEFIDTGPDRFCSWTHHDLSSKSIRNAIERRAQRLLDCLYSENTLLVYYDQVNRPIEFYRAIVEPFVKLYPCKILIISPIHDYEGEPKIIYDSESLYIIECKMSDPRLRFILNYIYTFNIIPRETLVGGDGDG